jgi:SAM-dependent methyltransferase
MNDRPTHDHVRHNRKFWDYDADEYQAAHGDYLKQHPLAWGGFRRPESELHVLGEVHDKDMLEIGCGGGQWSVALGSLGARPVGLDVSRAQLRHARSASPTLPLLAADAEQLPFADAAFDIVFCDHGAMSFCDPYRTVPEVARVLRSGGRFAFNISTLLRNLCYPVGDPDAPVSRKLHGKYFGARAFDWGDGTIDYQIPHGEWIALFGEQGLAVEDLLELRAPKRAASTYGDYVDHDWARRWPAEEIWRVRKL